MASRKKKWSIGIGVFIALLVILNFALEPVALHYANKALSELKGYKGSIKNIDIHLYRGAYRIDTLVIEKVGNGKTSPFFRADGIDISIEWKALFKGAIVSEFYVERPVINFIKQGDDVATGGGNDFLDVIKNLSPITINKFTVQNGQVHYLDFSSKPKVDIAATQLNAEATNLRNVDDKKDKLPSSIFLFANTSGNGRISSHMKINALKKVPDFDFNLELKHMDLTYLKDFTDAYAKFTFKRGQLYLSTELAMEDGRYNGYLKPVLENIKIIDLTPDTPEEKKRPFFRRLWELIVGAGVSVVKNHPKDRLATKVPLKGDVNSNESFTWTAIVNILKNGFVKAFDKDVEGSIDINDAKSGKVEK
ncbi:MAG: DUF748 domain-containing protein [Flavobacterium sp.]|uniref:DUF748 domain-containing protein n=1 Tax=Flavobacterium sp. TaxID=239 RepID=UPI001224D137|nr:DUF748 domain-containing protein [Flavobacterium sp.]RZJ66307.1 MAG: DUF748 domain-containing protein [Flavobacterium sp.]